MKHHFRLHTSSSELDWAALTCHQAATAAAAAVATAAGAAADAVAATRSISSRSTIFSRGFPAAAPAALSAAS
eukprot:CAMPEP_0198693836 /NCGR_PEP_ID=MMETSP1468-20131203/258303_1 /TAXON_ID=1461545 /ORGANISM="Mantoniella sp, Strain CCMP1436" /LENGTH=72 /DNA_ID=CAMNT_0044448703 /DNA_START=157 /DNA_END=370 /DNA_ORIENTATION=-